MSDFFIDEFDDADDPFGGAEPELSQELEQLRKIDLFRDLPPEGLEHLCGHLSRIRLSAGEAFINQYDEIKQVYLLPHTATVSEMNRYVDDFERNGLFGARELITEQEHFPYTATAVSDSDAWFVDRETFVDVFKQIPGLYESMLEALIRDLTFELGINKKEKTNIQEQRRITREILENMGVGTITIDHAGEIGQYYNNLAKRYLDRDKLAGLPFADVVLSDDRDTLRKYYQALQLLFSGNRIDPEMIINLLPKEISINNRSLSLKYSFAQDTNGNVSYVFVRMADVTFEKRQEAKAEQEQKIIAVLQSNIGSYLAMLESVKATLNLVKSLNDADIGNDLVAERDMLAAVMRSLHSSKGICGQHELIALKSVIHDLESEIQNIGRADAAFNRERFLELTARFREEYAYAVSLKNSLGPDIINLLQGVNFSQEEFDALLASIAQETHDETKRIIHEKILVVSDRIFDNWSQDIEKLAEKNGKQIEFATEIEADLRLHETLAHKLNVELGHLYRNCVDHGIETPGERQRLGKPETGTISISAYKREEMLVIEISDDGAGLDEDKIVRMARANPNLPQRAVEEYIADSEIWKILFMPGFSSKEAVTGTSGRGVGLDAVWETLTSLRGKIRMDSKKDVGSTFSIEIPLSAGILA